MNVNGHYYFQSGFFFEYNLGAIYKRRLLNGEGRWGQKCKNLLSKKTTKKEGGGHKIGKIGRRRLWMAHYL